MPQPFANLTFRCAADEALATKEMPESMESSVLKTNVSLGRRKPLLQRLDDLLFEDLQRVILSKWPAASRMKNSTVAAVAEALIAAFSFLDAVGSFAHVDL